MTEHYIVPNIYTDMSNQSQGYFAFRFTCQRCYWQIDSRPLRSTVSTVSNIMDIGVGLLGGFLGRAAEAGQKIYGSQWHQEQADALQKSWAQVQHEFHTCPKCSYTVCMRCFNIKLNLCNNCAPDLKAEGAQFLHEQNIEAQRQQIQEGYRAPRFDISAIPSAVTPELVQPSQRSLPSTAPAGYLPAQAGIESQRPASASSGNLETVMCPNCRCMGPASKFCQDCGSRLPAPERVCHQCSSPLQNNPRFCPECGTRLQMAT
ncbi:hypothetical protein EPA93_28865 [Ktedonosporobacter rubrisoli]|uniref:DZANK-type domain-containing protein n=1 Tax=Ktedonosporobacter rubrisoli TaxID=2509675 RepID=A0A4P6JW45_KTERU|nr:zinc ribbon domain-containing protein [Ktedonosporobacter rubrisoli]QBD79774.1 hypothetical protein EPA93_28865 [Ktedonosporobacter rubrisoli]